MQAGNPISIQIMKIGIAQINAIVGDFPGNAKRIMAAYRECLELGAELVVVPEMALVGYPPQDLMYKSQFVSKCLQALDYLADETAEVPMLVVTSIITIKAAPVNPSGMQLHFYTKGLFCTKFGKRYCLLTMSLMSVATLNLATAVSQLFGMEFDWG